MSYFAPYSDSSGLHIPTYQDILDDLISQAQSIYGSDIYLENDSSDYQMLSVIALKISDTMQAIQLAWNDRSPATAIGAALDSLVAINGISRQAASYSTCTVTISGTAGTIITNGVVRDVNGYMWDLPASVEIGSEGTEEVSVTCQTIGAITALTGNISSIVTPTAGWTSVTNDAAATPGTAVENDSALRARQALSTAMPSQTLLAGTKAAVAAVDGVTRSRVYENNTGSVDSYGLEAHSIAVVAEGGADQDIAEAIYYNRGIGCYISGDHTVTVEGETMRFYRPSEVPIYVTLGIHDITNSLSDDLKEEIKQGIADYLNGLGIGQRVTISALYGIAMGFMSDYSNPDYSITSVEAGESSDPSGTVDLTLDFDEVASGDIDNIEIEET